MTPAAALPQTQMGVNNIPGNTDTVIYKPDGRGPSYMNGGQLRNPLPPQPYDEDAFPPPPPVRPNGNGSADASLNDSASTTQSNVTSECSEAECDREPLVKPGGNVGNRASLGSPRDLTTEEVVVPDYNPLIPSTFSSYFTILIDSCKS